MSTLVRRMAMSPVNYWLSYCLDVGGSLAIVSAGFATSDRGLEASVLALVLGLVAYTFYEYAVHRWLYHGPLGALDALHAFHHDRPRTRYSPPFFMTLGVCALNIAAARAFVDLSTAAVFGGAVLLGYGYQSVVHALFHSRRYRPDSLMGRLRRHHLVHHRDGRTNYGVITSFWDRLLGTQHPTP